MKINDIVEQCHMEAKEKGWWDKKLNPLERHMLMVSEIAEATEAFRGAKPEHYIDENGKPEGEAVELADCVIRIFDYAGYKGWNMEKIISEKLEYNRTRAYRHGNKQA